MKIAVWNPQVTEISSMNLRRVAKELGEGMIDEQLQKADRDGHGEINEEVWICTFLDVFRVVMRVSISPTGLIVMPVFACSDKGDYLVSAGCSITVKFNA